jgi:RNA polymerase sigma-70 factor (ECF subfamily)
VLKRTRQGACSTQEQRRDASTAGVEALAARCQRGDREACEKLIDAYRPMVQTLARTTGRDREWVEDTVVEILVQLYRSIGSFRWNSSLKTWVYSVASKVCAAELRKARRRQAHSLRSDQAGVSEENPLDLMVEKDRQERALQMISRLPEKYRVAVVLRHISGCTYQELADILGVPLGTAKTRVFQGMRRVRRMGQEGGDEGES